MNQNNWIQLLVALIVLGGPILQKVLQVLAKQKAKSRADLLRQKQMEEALRTGRPVGEEPQPTARAEADLVAARRKAQLEELRRRARERAQPSGPIASIPGSPGPTVPMGRPAPQARPQAQPQQRPQRPATNQRPTSPSRPAQRPPTSPPARTGRQGAGQSAERRQAPAPPPPRPVMAPPEPSRRLVPEAPVAPRPVEVARRSGVLSVRTASVADWRRAIIMREVLDPPLALR
jgi:hypothetical protein